MSFYFIFENINFVSLFGLNVFIRVVNRWIGYAHWRRTSEDTSTSFQTSVLRGLWLPSCKDWSSPPLIAFFVLRSVHLFPCVQTVLHFRLSSTCLNLRLKEVRRFLLPLYVDWFATVVFSVPMQKTNAQPCHFDLSREHPHSHSSFSVICRHFLSFSPTIHSSFRELIHSQSYQDHMHSRLSWLAVIAYSQPVLPGLSFAIHGGKTHHSRTAFTVSCRVTGFNV